MIETVIKFIDEDVNGIDITTLAKVSGKDIMIETINKIKAVIAEYKSTSEWDIDGCLKLVEQQLKSEGYKVDFINPALEISF